MDSYHGETDEVSEFESMPGKGVSGYINGVKYTIGSPELVGASPGKGTTVYLQGPGGIAGRITLADKIRDSASKTISELRDRGIRVMMLTGDSEEVAAEVAGELGVESYHGGLLPEDKMKVIDEVRKGDPLQWWVMVLMMHRPLQLQMWG